MRHATAPLCQPLLFDAITLRCYDMLLLDAAATPPLARRYFR